MTALAVSPSTSTYSGEVTLPFREGYDEAPMDRNCLVLSDDLQLISEVEIAVTARCFRFEDYTETADAACSALFSPPSLAVVDLRLACLNEELDEILAFCRQLASERSVQLVLVGCEDCDQDERDLRRLGAVYFFRSLPTAEEIEQLAISVSARVRVRQRRATLEMLRRAVKRPCLRKSGRDKGLAA